MIKHQGLTASQVAENQKKYGLNKLSPPAKKSAWRLFLAKFNDPIIKILLIAATISMVTGLIEGNPIEGIGILVAVFLATTMAFINEYKAGKEFDILNQVSDDVPYKAIREGRYQNVAKQFLTVDDLVLLETGDEVPADALILEAISLELDEASLTGESLPVTKRAYSEGEEVRTSYPPFKVFKGSLVRNGHATVQITAIGDAAEMGQTARLASEESSEVSPLNRQLERLSKVIGRIGFGVALLLMLVLALKAHLEGTLSINHTIVENLHSFVAIFMVAVTIIVVSVPEGLAMSVTLSLAYSMRKMTASHTLVRHMEACETIGAATVICTDKTGTLTMNKMTVANDYFVDKLKNASLINYALTINSSANLTKTDHGYEALGNPTEGALLLYLQAHNINYEELRLKDFILKEQLPFSTDYKFMASYGLIKATSQEITLVKGSPEIILSRCSNYGDKTLAEWEALIKTEQAMAHRTLGFAYLEGRPAGDFKALKNLKWLGFVGIADPIRAEVVDAVKSCHDAGIEVKMLTGDSIETARQIGKEVGILTTQNAASTLVITGSDFEALSDEELETKVDQLAIMARARPQDKLRLVKILQKKQAIVAVTGDGTNDGPALNHANVGFSMGITGTAIAKEASDIILLDDSFSSIVNAVMWGRTLYANIQRFLLFQLTINVSALGIALIGPFIGINLPITVMQMLWINLIMDTFAALALATEAAEKSILTKKPRNASAFIITPAMAKNILAWGVVFIAFFMGYLLKYKHQMDLYRSTLFFNIFVLAQFWNLFNARFFDKKIALHMFFKNRAFTLIALSILVGQFCISQFGGSFFRTTPLPISTWLAILGATSLVFWLNLLGRGFKKLKA